MPESMRYITIEENELYEKIAEYFGIQDYSPTTSLTCHSSVSEDLEIFNLKERKEKKKSKRV